MSVRNPITDVRAVNFSRTLKHPETGEPVQVTSFEIQVARSGEHGWQAIPVIEREWSDDPKERAKE